MTDEELATKAKTGDEAALMELWENKRGMAYTWARSTFRKHWELGDTRGSDLDDLMQTAFIALMRAVYYFDPDKPWAFSTCYGNTLKREFADLLRTREGHKLDALNYSVSIDAPMGGTNESDTDLWADILEDPADCFEEVEDRIYQEQLHNALENALSQIPEKQGTAVRLRYLQDKGWAAVAEMMGFEYSYVRRLAKKGLESLRQEEIRTELEEFVDLRTNFYRNGSVKDQTSGVELNVIRREEIRNQQLWRINHDTHRPAVI